jgi:hypothetical protein
LNQRIFRGFSDKETWNLDKTISMFILPRLRRFKKLKNGYPCGMTEERWDHLLGKMIVAFEILNDSDFSYEDDLDLRVERTRKVKEGLDLFSKYYMDLWW